MKTTQILKKTRKKLDFSQRKFAKFLCISKSAYNRYELGLRKPPRRIIKKCCRILGIKIYFRRTDDISRFDKNKITCGHKKICKKLDILRRVKMYPIKRLSYHSHLPYWKCWAILSGNIIPKRKDVTKLVSTMNFSSKILRENNFKKLFQKYKNTFHI